MRRARGFTIVELIAVMTVMSVIFVVAAPIMTQMADNREVVAARTLLRDLTFARQHAIATGTTTWVVFDATAETWTLYAEDPDNPGRANRSIMTDPATGEDFIQNLGVPPFQGVGITAVDLDGNDEVGFGWLGEPYDETEGALGDSTVTLSGGNVINVEGRTGLSTYD